MSKYNSCPWIEHGIVFDHCNKVRICNNFNSKNGGRPVLFHNYKGELLDKEELFKIKNEHRKAFKEGNLLPECENCVLLENKEWDEEDYIDRILLTPWVKCNSKCIYCPAPNDKYVKANTKEYNIVPVVKKMIEDGTLKKDGIIDFAGGEPTIYKDFETLLKLFVDNEFEKIDVHTNAIKYSKAIEEGIEKGTVNILVSIDAGTKKTHRKIKKVWSYDTVWKNLTKYSKLIPAKGEIFNLVRTKYIILPGVNDSNEEIEQWLTKCETLGLKNLVLNIDYNWVGANIKNVPDSIYDLIDFTVQKSNEMGAYCHFYAQAREILQQRITKKEEHKI